MCRKGFYPCEYIDNDDSKLNETGLPPKWIFYSKVSRQVITEEDDKQCQNV